MSLTALETVEVLKVVQASQEKAELDQIVAQASDVKMKLVSKEGETI